jgi:hypothetical protein
MARGARALALELTSAEQAALEKPIRRRRWNRRWLGRARAVLACAEPEATDLEVARLLGVSRPAVAHVAMALCPASAGGTGRCAACGSTKADRRPGSRASDRGDPKRRCRRTPLRGARVRWPGGPG